MIDVNRVYQTVQRILNIEQRGQLPPTDFNYFANLAQLDMFNKLMSDVVHFEVGQKGMLTKEFMERVDIFNVTETIAVTDDVAELPNDVYKIHEVIESTADGMTLGNVIEKVDHKMLRYINQSPLTTPSALYPKYTRNQSVDGVSNLSLFPKDVGREAISIDYVKLPTTPVWGFRTIGGTGLYDNSISTDFQLHPAMEDELIKKVLFYAGVSIREEQIAQIAQGDMQADDQTTKT